MQIFVNTGSATKTFEVAATDSVLSLTQQLEGRLTFGGKTLVGEKTFESYNIQAESTLFQVGELLGGHCQVPCGIFDDPKLVAEVKEQCATIRKAMMQINELHAKTDALSFNQKTRWVMTKEEHAKKIIAAISEYGLCQRVKPVGAPGSPFKTEGDFMDALKSHHAVMVKAMQAKQSVDPAAADALDHAVADWAKMYLPH